jgi:hypothetical protein
LEDDPDREVGPLTTGSADQIKMTLYFPGGSSVGFSTQMRDNPRRCQR